MEGISRYRSWFDSNSVVAAFLIASSPSTDASTVGGDESETAFSRGERLSTFDNLSFASHHAGRAPAKGGPRKARVVLVPSPCSAMVNKVATTNSGRHGVGSG